MALDLVLIQQAREKANDAGEAFKRALISHDPAHFIPLAYPEWMVKRDDEITHEDLTESQGEWTFEQADLTREEIEAQLAYLMIDNSEITLSGEELEAVQSDTWDDEFPGYSG